MDPQQNQKPVIPTSPEPDSTLIQPQPQPPQPSTEPTPQPTAVWGASSQSTLVNQGAMTNQGNTQTVPDPPKHGLLIHLGMNLGIFIILTVLFLLPVLHGITNYSFNGLGEAGSTQGLSTNPGCVSTSTSVDTGLKGFPLAYSFTRTISSTTNCTHSKPCGGSFESLCSYQQGTSQNQVTASSKLGMGIDVAVALALTLIISLVLFIVRKIRKPSRAGS